MSENVVDEIHVSNIAEHYHDEGYAILDNVRKQPLTTTIEMWDVLDAEAQDAISTRCDRDAANS